MIAIFSFVLAATLTAYVTFKILHSSARVTSEKYEIGGAAAVLVIVLVICLGSYYKLVTQDCAELRKFTATYTIAGQIIPNEPNVLVVVASQETTTGIDGTFRIPTKCVDNGANSLIRIYVLRSDGTFVPINVYDENHMKDLKIKLPGNIE
jgi:hypothetical protein